MHVDFHRCVPYIPALKHLHLRPAPPGASVLPLLPGRPAEKAVAQPASGPCTRIWQLAPAIAHFARASPSPGALSQSSAFRLLQILLWWRPSSEAAGLDYVLAEQLVAMPRRKMDTLLALFPAAGLEHLDTTSALPPSAVIAHVSLRPLPASSVAQLHLAFFVALGPELPQLLQRCAVCPTPAILQGFDGLDDTCHQLSALLGG